MAQVKAMTVLSRRLPRKKKKRKKKKLPRDGSSCGRARRRHRQWHVAGRLGGLVRLHAVFPSFFGRPEWPGFLGGMDEKDSYDMAAPVVESGSGMCYAAGCVAPRVLLPSVVDKPRCSIMAVMDQKDSALVVNHGSGTCLVCFPGVPAPRAVFFPPVVRPKMFDIMACMNQRDIYVAWCLWFQQQKTVDSPQLQFFVGRRFSCHGAEAVSHGLAVQQTIEILLLILNTVIDVPVVQVVQVPSCMAFTCSEFACGVQDHGRFWKITSGWIPYSAPVGDAEACPMVQTVCRTTRITVLL